MLSADTKEVYSEIHTKQFVQNKAVLHAADEVATYVVSCNQRHHFCNHINSHLSQQFFTCKQLTKTLRSKRPAVVD